MSNAVRAILALSETKKAYLFTESTYDIDDGDQYDEHNEYSEVCDGSPDTKYDPEP